MNTRRFIKQAVFFMLFFLLPVCLNAAKVKIATLEWPPFVGKTIPDQGVATKNLSLIFEQMGDEFELVFVPWARVLSDTEQGKVAGGYPAYYTEERAKKFLVTESFVDSKVALFQHSESNIKFEKLEDLKGLKIGVVRGYANTKEFDAADFLTKEPANSDILNLKKLVKKRLDLVVMDPAVLMQLIKTKYPDAEGKVKMVGKPLEVKPMHLLLSRKFPGNEELLKKFNEAAKKLKADGKLK